MASSQILRQTLTGVENNPGAIDALDRLILFDTEGNPIDPATLGSIGTGAVTNLWAHGNSILAGFAQKLGPIERLAKMFGATVTNRAVSGSIYAYPQQSGATPPYKHDGGIGAMAQDLANLVQPTAGPYLPLIGGYVIAPPLNDIAAYGINESVRAHMIKTMVAIIAMHRAGGFVFSTDASNSYSGAPATVPSKVFNFGPSVKIYSANGVITTTVPADHTGKIWLSFAPLGGASPNGAVVQVAVDGVNDGPADDYRGTNPNTVGDGYQPNAFRVRPVTIPKDGSPHTVTMTITNCSAFGISYMGYFHEAPDPAPGVIIKAYRLQNEDFIPTGTDIWQHEADAAAVTFCNEIIDAAVAQFDEFVTGIETLSYIQRNNTFFSADQAHLNDYGSFVLTGRILDGFNTIRLNTAHKAALQQAQSRINRRRVMWPFPPGLVDGVSAAGTNQIRACRVFVPVSGILKDLYVWIGTASAMNVLGQVFDTGDAVAGQLTSLWAGASVAAVDSSWIKLGDPNIAVVENQEIDLAVMTSNGTGTIGRRTIAGSGVAALPTGFLLVPGGAPGKVFWNRTEGAFAAPASVTDANALTGNSTVPFLMARVLPL